MTEPLFAPVTPVFEIDGEVIGDLARDIIRMEIDEDILGMKRLYARFVAFGPSQGQDARLLYLDGNVFDFGRTVRVSVGVPATARYAFEGQISAIEGSFEEAFEPEMSIHAEDRLMSLRMTRRMRTYESMTDADIASEVAQLHGLSAETDAPGPEHRLVQQWNMSDLAFLRERARLIRAEIWLEGDTLYFVNRGNRSTTDLTLVRGNDLISLQVRADLAHQRTSVHVTGYDAERRERIHESADGDIIGAEVEGGRTGPDILSRAFGERVSYRVRETPLTSEVAAEWARGEMLRRGRGFVHASGITDGTPDMMVGSRLTIERAGPVFEGEKYYVTELRHTFDLTHGYRTHFHAERANTMEIS